MTHICAQNSHIQYDVSTQPANPASPPNDKLHKWVWLCQRSANIFFCPFFFTFLLLWKEITAMATTNKMMGMAFNLFITLYSAGCAMCVVWRDNSTATTTTTVHAETNEQNEEGKAENNGSSTLHVLRNFKRTRWNGNERKRERERERHTSAQRNVFVHKYIILG